MANEKRLISLCGECGSYDWKKHRCVRGAKDLGKAQDPFYKDCPLPKGVEVVQCKDCYKSYIGVSGRMCGINSILTNGIRMGGKSVSDNHFCSYGERWREQ